MAKRSAEFTKYKGRVQELANHDARVRGGKACVEVRRKKKAMREALELIMAAKADEQTAEAIRRRFPELKNTNIDGYIEVAALLRSHGRKNYQATVKMVELMDGAAPKQNEGDKTINIIVANPEDAKVIADI